MPSSILAEEGRLEPFLGPARIEMQQLFFGQRFPNVVVCQDGSVLATWGNDGVVARRSEDGGAHWRHIFVTVIRPTDRM
jgi:sialidase-1